MRAAPALPALAAALFAAACAHHAPEVAAAPAAPPPAPAVAPATPNADSAARAQRDAERKRELAERLAADSGALKAMLHFDFDRALLNAADTAALNSKLALLQRDPQLRIQIAGNCDDRGSGAYNLALGERRAAAAKRYLVFYGIDAHRIDIISYGSERPVASGDTEASWAMNRNDEFVALTALHAGT